MSLPELSAVDLRLRLSISVDIVCFLGFCSFTYPDKHTSEPSTSAPIAARDRCAPPTPRSGRALQQSPFHSGGFVAFGARDNFLKNIFINVQKNTPC